MNFFINKNRNLFIYLFLISLFVVGIFIFSDYGLSVDSDNSRVNGFVSLKYIFEIFFPDYVFKIDNILNVPNINTYDERWNGAAFDLPMAFFEFVFKVTDTREIYLFRHFFNFTIFIISVFIFYKIVTDRFNSYITGIIGAAFLVLSPRIFAESFYNTKDILLMSLFIINLYSGIKFLDNPNIKTAIIFSAISAYAVDLRVLVIFFPLLISLIHILNILRMNNFKKDKLIPLLVLLTSLPIFITFFWPYLWSNPIGNFIKVFEMLSNFFHPIYNFYFGEYLSSKNLPWHYPIIWILITTPIFYTLLFLIGFFFIFLRLIKRLLKIEKNDSYTDMWRSKKELHDIIFLFTFLIPLFSVIILNSSLYDGWRHLYFIYPSFLMISLQGLNLVKTIFFKKKNLIINFSTIILLLPTFYWMVLNHPLQNIYFNFLAEKKFNKNFDMDYWGISNKTALEYIAQRTNKEANVYNLNTSDLELSKKILIKKNRDLIIITYNLNEANYIINSYRDWNGSTNPLDYTVPSNFEIFYEIKVDDVVINTIYKKK